MEKFIRLHPLFQVILQTWFRSHNRILYRRFKANKLEKILSITLL